VSDQALANRPLSQFSHCFSQRATHGVHSLRCKSIVRRRDRESLLEQYRQVRQQTEAICQPLATEDYCIQTMRTSAPQVAYRPCHLVLRTFLLLPSIPLIAVSSRFDYLFTPIMLPTVSPFPAQRGLLSRPPWRDLPLPAYVDEAMIRLLSQASAACWDELHLDCCWPQPRAAASGITVSDIKHIFAFNPLRPVYQPMARPSVLAPATALHCWNSPAGKTIVTRRSFASTMKRPTSCLPG